MKTRHRAKENYPKLGSNNKYIMLNMPELELVAGAIQKQGKTLNQGERRQ
jgi:hypothetical protein